MDRDILIKYPLHPLDLMVDIVKEMDRIDDMFLALVIKTNDMIDEEVQKKMNVHIIEELYPLGESLQQVVTELTQLTQTLNILLNQVRESVKKLGIEPLF